MKLLAPCQSLDFEVRDIYGEYLRLSEYQGKAVVLSFFRDIQISYCSVHVFELSRRFKKWRDQGIEIIAVFSSTAQEIKEFIESYPVRFRVVADPDLTLHSHYGAQSSLPSFARNILSSSERYLSADFLIDQHGQIVDLWYANNQSEHISRQRLESFTRDASSQINSTRLLGSWDRDDLSKKERSAPKLEFGALINS